MSGLADLVKSAGSGARGARFPDVGDIIGGTVISSEVIPSRDEDGDVEFWEDGKPKQKVRVIVQTDLDEGEDEQGKPDDGKRAIYIKWWSEQRKAFIDALARADADDVLPGGKFYAKYAAQGERIKKAWSPTKEMRYKYKPPANVPDFDEDEPHEKPAAKAPAKLAAKPAAKAAAKTAAKSTAKKRRASEDDDLADADEPLDSKAALDEAGLGDGF